MNRAYRQMLPQLRARVKPLLDAGPRCHDWDHTSRVCSLAERLARAEKADEVVVEYGALLHDIGRAAEFADEGETCHALTGAQQVPGLLRELGIEDNDFIARIVDCVRMHRYRNREGSRPSSLEAKIVFDADKLDSMGAIGVGRAFHFAGNVGARVHNTVEEALSSEAYSREDTAYREFLAKLRHLHDAVLTPSGKQIAEKRHRFMSEFFERLNLEVENEDA